MQNDQYMMSRYLSGSYGPSGGGQAQPPANGIMGLHVGYNGGARQNAGPVQSSTASMQGMGSYNLGSGPSSAPSGLGANVPGQNSAQYGRWNAGLHGWTPNPTQNVKQGAFMQANGRMPGPNDGPGSAAAVLAGHNFHRPGHARRALTYGDANMSAFLQAGKMYRGG